MILYLLFASQEDLEYEVVAFDSIHLLSEPSTCFDGLNQAESYARLNVIGEQKEKQMRS